MEPKTRVWLERVFVTVEKAKCDNSLALNLHLISISEHLPRNVFLSWLFFVLQSPSVFEYFERVWGRLVAI